MRRYLLTGFSIFGIALLTVCPTVFGQSAPEPIPAQISLTADAQLRVYTPARIYIERLNSAVIRHENDHNSRSDAYAPGQPMEKGNSGGALKTMHPPVDLMPFKVCVIQDKSQSGQFYKTPQMQEHQLRPLTDQLAINGGDVAGGFIQHSSNYPLIRAFVPPQPQLPVRKKALNSRKELEAELTYQQELQAWARARDERLLDAEAEIARFYEQLRDSLETAPTAGESDVAGSLLRCDRFLSEPIAEYGGSEVHKIMLFISDVEHGVRSSSLQGNDNLEATIPKPYELESNAQIYVVNGRKHKGSLAKNGYHVIAFEGIDAAIRSILSIVRSGGVR